MELQNHLLLKFISKKKFANDFMRGKLYMNSLDYFWNDYRLINAEKEQKEMQKTAGAALDKDARIIAGEKTVTGQMDMLEGVYGTVSADAIGFDKEFAECMATDVFLRAEGYRYCNVQCFYRLDYVWNGNVVSWDQISGMEEFGEYVVIIDDEAKFLRLVDRAMNRRKLKYLCGSVRYRPPLKDQRRVTLGPHAVVKADSYFVDIQKLEVPDSRVHVLHGDCFCKMDAMQSQREWRIAVYRGIEDTSAYTLELDCGLKGIAHVVRAADLTAELDAQFQEGRVKPGMRERWYGNADRRQLRKYFYELGDNRASVFAIIGKSCPAENGRA